MPLRLHGRQLCAAAAGEERRALQVKGYRNRHRLQVYVLEQHILQRCRFAIHWDLKSGGPRCQPVWIPKAEGYGPTAGKRTPVVLGDLNMHSLSLSPLIDHTTLPKRRQGNTRLSGDSGGHWDHTGGLKC
jgi:hypothetical protein